MWIDDRWMIDDRKTVACACIFVLHSLFATTQACKTASWVGPRVSRKAGKISNVYEHSASVNQMI